MIIRARTRRTNIISAYVMAVVILFLGRQLFSPASEPVENALIFISDSDSIDAGRDSNSVYRIGLDGRGLKRIVGSIPHGAGYLRTSDIDCHAASQQLVIASHRRDLNGFHHALLDGSGLHLDQPAAGDLLCGDAANRDRAERPGHCGLAPIRRLSRNRATAWSPAICTPASFNIFRAPTAERSYISPDFSLSGRQLAYIIRRHDDNSSWISRLVIANAAGRQETVIYETRRQFSDVAWSPTGSGWRW